MRVQTYTLPMQELVELVKLQLSEGGFAKLTVTGCSMLPMLRDGRDTVDLIPVDKLQKKGAVILYRRENGQYVLHRIIQVCGGSYICSGDNQYMREPVAQTQLIAVVNGFTRKGRHYTCKHFGYSVYTAAMVGLFFLRRPYIALRRMLGRLGRKIRKLTR